MQKYTISSMPDFPYDDFEILRCRACGFEGPSSCFDVLGAKDGFLFCPRCNDHRRMLCTGKFCDDPELEYQKMVLKRKGIAL